MTRDSLPVSRPATPPAVPPVRIASRQIRHLAQAVVLEESGTSGLVRFSMLVACLTALAFVVWAGLTDIPEIAAADGVVIPSGQIKTLQHLEGGIVAEIVSREGDIVEAGQSIIRLDPAQALSDLDQTLARELALMLKAERLRAFAEDRPPRFDPVPPGQERLLSDNESILTSQIRARDSAQAVILSQIEQKRADIKLLERQQQSLRAQLAPLREQVAMREELVGKGLLARSPYLDTRRELSRVEGELDRLVSQEATAREALGESENRLIDNRTTMLRQTMDELGVTINELAQVRESLGRLRDRVDRLDIRSPTRGIVKGLTVKNAGAVIPAGGVVCDVVPFESELKVEARINTRDIGHLSPGQPVKVKVTTFDFARYGAVHGTLTRVSASSFTDEKGIPFFKGVIALDHDYVGPVPGRFRVTPGMTVSAEIITGEKTLLQYILKPIFTQVSQSFHER